MVRARHSCEWWLVLALVAGVAGCRLGGTRDETAQQPGAAEEAAGLEEAEESMEPAEASEPRAPVAEPAASPPAPAARPSRPRPQASAPAPQATSHAGHEHAEHEHAAAGERAPTAKPAPDISAAGPHHHPAEPEILEVTVPEGTVLELELLTALDTSLNRAGDEIQARTLSAVYLKGNEVLPKGTYVEGRVTQVQSSGRVKGKATLAFTFDRIQTRSGTKKIRTSYVEKQAASGKKKDATVVGGAAGLGAVVGAIIGGKKGAAIGATIGGAGGTGVVLATKGEEIRLPVGTEVNVRLDEPLTLALN